MIFRALAIPIDERSDGRRIIETTRPERALREEVVDHLAQILAHPGAQGDAEGSLRPLDDAARQPARRHSPQNGLLRQATNPEPVAESECELDDSVIDKWRGRLDALRHGW